MTKIYTKGGDKGQTGLFSGERVSKNHPLVNAYGTVDELNSVLGIARALHNREDHLASLLHFLQTQLFSVGADLASGTPGPGIITEDDVERFEVWIDELTAQMPPLRNFVLPSGHPVAAHLHQARTVGRRAERLVVAASGEAQFDYVIVRYLNRLADFLFVLARYANFVYGVEDEPWSAVSGDMRLKQP